MLIGMLSWIAFIAWALSEIFMLIRAKLLRRDVFSVKADKGSYWVIWVVIYLGIFVAFSFHSFGWGKVSPLIANISAVCMLAGVVLRLWSSHVLGINFTQKVSIDSKQELVKNGPYKIIRHPSYTGALLAFAFLGLALNSWIASCVILIILLPCYIYRIRIEENALISHFGSVYNEYRQTTWKLIPYLW